MRGLRHPYMWGRNHPVVIDALIAAGVAAFGLLTAYAGPVEAPLHGPDALNYALTVASCVPLLVRRRHPVAVFMIVWPLTMWHTLVPYTGAGPVLAALFALYAVAAHARSRRTGVVALVAMASSVTLLLMVPRLEAGWDDVVLTTVFLSSAWLLGDNMRIRRAYVATVEERAERLERERDVDAQRAVLEERARIARELHDVVAHSMSVMVVQAGAARRTLAHDQDKAAEAVGHIESTGRSALEEMRRLVSVLRGANNGADDEPALLPQPQPGDLGKLILGCQDAGLDVSLSIAGDQRPLPPGLGLVVYRVVQEALTNTIRHAGPARATVCLDYRPDVIVVTVSDDGRGAAAPAGAAPGHGLAGMRERVALYGGELAAGPQVGGGFRVVAQLPVAPDKVLL